jgi:hypothetical protein
VETRAEYDWWELGRAEGMALGLLTILNYRGIPVPSRIHDRIEACRDAGQIQGWLAAAAKARSIYDIFPDPANTPRRRMPRAVRTSGWLLAGHHGAARRRWAPPKRPPGQGRRPQASPWPEGATIPER